MHCVIEVTLLDEMHGFVGKSGNSTVKLKANCYQALTLCCAGLCCHWSGISARVYSESSTAIGPFGLLSVMPAWVGRVLYALQSMFIPTTVLSLKLQAYPK